MKHRILSSLIAMSSLLAFSPAFASPAGTASAEQTILADNTAAKETVNIAVGANGLGHRMPFSDEQLEKLGVIKSKFLDETGPKMTELRSLNRQLRTCLTQETVDAKQARELQGKISQMKAELSDLKLQMRLDTMNVLTPEQRKALHQRALKKLAFGGGKGFAGGHYGCHGRSGRSGFHHKQGVKGKFGAGGQFKRPISSTATSSQNS